jgi:cobalt/nickel transport system ATP-binding protein
LLFQDADDQLFSPTVLEDVAFGPLNLGKSRDEARNIAVKTLQTLGLTALQDRITYKLSGGEKKLVSLATVLAMEPRVLLLDEPTSGLDEDTKKTLLRVLSELNLASVLISHEFDFLSEITRSIHAMEEGRIRTDPDVHVHFHKHAHVHGSTPHKHK